TAVPKAGGAVLITWSAPSWASGGYSVRRGTSVSGPFTEIGTTASGVTSYTDSPGTNGSTYYYVVRGLSGHDEPGLDSTMFSAPGDSAAPTVASTVPVEAATAVSTATSITVNFSEAMETALTGTKFSLVTCTSSSCATTGAAVSGTQSWLSSTQLFFTADVALSQSQWYGIKFLTGATDVVGNVLSTTGCPHLSG